MFLKAVILAGGSGKRVFPLATNRPKPMFKILGKPLIRYVIDNLMEAGIKDFIIVTGHSANMIKNYLKDGSSIGCNIEYSLQKESLGMANALETAKDLIKEDEYFFVINANDIFDLSLITSMIEEYKKGCAEIVLSCKPTNETWKFGILQLEGDVVRKIVEKPEKGQEPSNLAVIGAYILPYRIFKYCEEVGVSDHQFEDAIQKSIDYGNDVHAVRYDGFFGSFKYPWDLFTLNEHLMEGVVKGKKIPESANISEKAIIEGDVWIGENVRIFEGAVVKGPCYIGNNSVIGTNSLIWNHTSIGDNCVVGYSSEIKNSIIGDNCWFHNNYIGDSIIGDRCAFGAGTVTANYRFDEKIVKVNVQGKKIESGRKKLGAIIGDNCKTGINVSIIPGIKIGPNSIVGPSVNLDLDLEPNKIVFVNRKSYIVKDNMFESDPSKRDELLKKLKK
jgi:UDP-N-acetylglucosamine diphosphorylase/glucosamine-1-phosphate N-acetyltransferase